MTIHALLFQEQTNGLYKGIYVHYDGAVDGVGQVLTHAYSTYQAFQPLIDKGCPLANLGLTPQTIPNDSKDARMMTLIQKNDLEWHKYTTLLSTQREHYLATSLDNLKDGQYYKYNDENQMEGYRLPTGEFLPYMPNKEAQRVYVQIRNGRWYMGEVNDKGYTKQFVQIYKNKEVKK